MEPKFQSSFIPKGPIAASGNQAAVKTPERSLLGFIALTIFSISVVLGLAVFGYNWYLSYNISQTGIALEAARSELDSGEIQELIRLDKRINATSQLLDNHVTVSPLFGFLEENTVRSVRFIDFNYSSSNQGFEVRMIGQARGYTAVALQAEAFAKSEYFKNQSVSDLRLDDEGNVVFSFSAVVDPSLVSYKRVVEREALFQVPEILEELESVEGEETATSTATSSASQI